MSQENIEIKVKQVLSKQLEIDINKINTESLLVNDLGMDSFGAVELAFGLSDEFNIKVPLEDLGAIKKVEDVVDYIGKKQGGK
ncbi:MAG: acyl carrier protein [Candidatus Margulisiibacteriota bacterium]